MFMKKYWLALSNIPKLGDATIKKLFDHFGSVEAIWEANLEKFSQVEGLTKSQAFSIIESRQKINLDEELNRVKEFDFITLEDPEYPEKLKNIYDPPPIIFYKGDITILKERAIAIVGTRKPSNYGSEIAAKFAQDLARLGFVIVSGMADGIDTAAHKGCLKAKGETIAVFGCGIDIIYPPNNIRLSESIQQSGCLISEFIPGTSTYSWTFPRRNRIISGLSLGVIIVEGGIDSGSLITAKLALEQGREVFAIPGQMDNKNSKGPHWLIKQGAKLVDSIEDIFEELNIPIPNGFEAQPRQKKDISELSANEKKICEILSLGPLHIDIIAEKTGMPFHEISSLLVILEIKGFVKQLPGKLFVQF